MIEDVIMTITRYRARLILVFAILLLLVSCSDDVPYGTAGGDRDSDSTSGTDDGTDPAEIVSRFDTIDCAGVGADSTTCEYEWCRKRQPYEAELASCAAVVTETCSTYIDCYDAYFTCMESACPLGTAVPTGDAKDPLYICDNEFTYCTLEL